ncbi:MAG TPA: VWA domain-containing protein, partial [Blastocatellia bacterium]
KNNKTVSGLTREDFELYDNDKLQNISFFSYELSKSLFIAEDTDQPRTLPRVITPKNLKRIVAFVVDTLHMSTDSIYRTRNMLREFIDTKMEPGDLVLVYPTGGGSGLLQQFTADQRLLRRAVNRLHQAYIFDSDGPARRAATSQAILADLPALPEARPGVPQAPGQGGLGAGSIGEGIEESDARATIAALNGTIQAMAKFPGRKIGVFISEGLRTFRIRTTSDLTDTTYRAARANVVFYTIDPLGLSTQGYSADGGQVFKERQPDALSPTGFAQPASNIPGTDLSRTRDDFAESQEALNMLAVETGGKFFQNNNSIRRGLDTMLEENSAYYLLGFQPADAKWDGKFHKLKVVVKGRPDLVVSTRKGYLAKTEKPASREATNAKMSEFQEAFYSPLVRRDIDVQLTPFYRDDTKREPLLTMMLHIDAARLSFKLDDGMHKNKLVMTGLLVGADGKVADSFSNTIDLNYKPEDYEGIRKDGLLVTRAIGIKPGVYQVRVLVREAESGNIGTANSFIEIPEIKGDRLALSSIFTDAQLMQQSKGADAVSSASSLSQRRFPRGGQFAYVLMVYNGKSE